MKKSTSQLVSEYENMLYKKLRQQVVKVVRSNSLLSGNYASQKLQTGLLGIDLLLGGGIRPGTWYTSFGLEQSGKSTLAAQTMIAAYRENVPMIQFWDYEGSTGADTEYLGRQFRSSGVKDPLDQIMGDPEEDKPIAYWGEDVLETFFDTMAALLRRLPDRQFINEKWYYVFDDDKYGKEMTEGKHDKAIKSKFGRLAIEGHANALGGLILLDSYPAMNPRSLDVDDAKAGMALQARVFSEGIRKIRGKLRPKGITIVGVNQLREKPGVTYGDPLYEPCGGALKFASDGRIRCTQIANPWGDGRIQQEPSVDGEGTDSYQHMKYKLAKNKVGGINNFEVFQRIWVSDKEGNAHGFDKVADTYQYLSVTGQIHGSRAKFLLPNELGLKHMNFTQFKQLIIGPKSMKQSVAKQLGAKTVPNIRAFCGNQIETGVAQELARKAASKASAKAKP